jgi:hypothetical protein
VHLGRKERGNNKHPNTRLEHKLFSTMPKHELFSIRSLWFFPNNNNDNKIKSECEWLYFQREEVLFFGWSMSNQ